jgi:hypothetical protein
MNVQPLRREPAEMQIIEALIDEHVRVDCNLVPIDENTWAIHGSIAVDGNVILAEFGNREDAEAALVRIAAAEASVAAGLDHGEEGLS